jgi:ATP-dependent DNA helicase RecG
LSTNQQKLPLPKLPFTLTAAQEQAIQEIIEDLQQKTPMNRLLVGDVGSGKTIVAALPASLLIKAQQNVCLIVPTKILAKQHYQTLSTLFPDINFVLIDAQSRTPKLTAGTFYIGTHALLNYLSDIKPGLVIYDEQQRFGVKHRQLEEYLDQKKQRPHLLSVTATPIPRTLMLSIFSHLEMSYLDQMPNSRKMATTWLVPQRKKEQAIKWLVQELLQSKPDQKQALIVCPFINPSSYAATENVAAVEEVFTSLTKSLAKVYQQLDIKPSSN